MSAEIRKNLKNFNSRITESGAKFDNFSYTSFSGFDPSDEIVQNMLDGAEVKTLKLTMMNAPMIAPRPGYMIGKVSGGY